MTMSDPRLGMVAGEPSGDLLAQLLLGGLKQRWPALQSFGLGGPQMETQGFEAWWNYDLLAVHGYSLELLLRLRRLFALRAELGDRLLKEHPDAFIGVDVPDFNLGLEARLKKAGTKTIHFVSPSIWAWRGGRIHKIREAVDHVLCLFPFEPEIYQRAGIAASYVGHPLADAIPLQPDRDAARAELGEAIDGPILALLPGSRLGEIQRMLPTFLQAARQLHVDTPGLRVLVPAANAQCREAIKAIVGDSPAIRVLDGQAQAAMIASDVVLLASGTAALEAMLCKRPMVIGHRISGLTYAIVKAFGLLKSAHVSLPNILAGETLVPELLQDDCTAASLHAALLHWFRDAQAVAALQPKFLALHETLRRDASARAAEAVAALPRRA